MKIRKEYKKIFLLEVYDELNKSWLLGSYCHDQDDAQSLGNSYLSYPSYNTYRILELKTEIINEIYKDNF